MISLTFLVACFNALLAIVMLVSNWKLNKNILFFVLYMLIISYTSVMYDMIINGGSVHLLMVLIGNSGPLFFLIGPLFYFFIRGLADEEKSFTDFDLLHFVPFFLNMIILLPYMFSPIEFKLDIARNSMQNLSFYMNSSLTLFPIWITTQVNLVVIVYYLIKSALLLFRSYRKVAEQHNPQIRVHLYRSFRWLFAIIAFSLVFTVFHFALTLFYRYELVENKYFNNEMFFVLSSMINLIFPAMILINPAILFGMPVVRPEMGPRYMKSGQEHDGLPDLRPHSYAEYFEDLAQKIIIYMENKQPYLNIDFSAEDLSEIYHIPHHHIQFCFKSYIGKSFKKVRDEYRVKYAMDLLRKSTCHDVDTLENVRFDSGFDSLSRFKKAFKNYTGLDPLSWCKENA